MSSMLLPFRGTITGWRPSSGRASRGLSCLESAFDPRQRSQSPERAGDALRASWRQRGRARRPGRRQPAARRRRETDAKALASALGSLKGPLMKVAQMLTTIPDAVPADFAAELMRLQSQAPPMGAGFVRRRMQAELGPDWRQRFAEFDFKPAAAASLGQVHRARSLAGEPLACKLQYPDMASAVETDLSNLDLLFSLHRRAGAAIDTREIAREIRERVREELDYEREAKIARLYRVMLADRPFVRVPESRRVFRRAVF